MNRDNSQMEIGMKTYLQGQGGDARQINYRTHPKIESEIGDLPSHPTPDVQSFLRRQWACNLSRICEEAWLPSRHFFAAAMAKHHVPEAEQNLLLSVMIYTKHSNYLPVGAPEITARTVAKIGEEIQAPPWCEKSGDAYRRLWLATLLMGANGHPFAFATARMAAAFDLASKNTVTRFLNVAKRQGHIKVLREGIARPIGGKAALYKLSNEDDYNKWQLIPNVETVPWLSARS